MDGAILLTTAQIHSPQQFVEARIVAEWIHRGNYFQADHAKVMLVAGFIQLRKRPIIFAKLGVELCDHVGHDLRLLH